MALPLIWERTIMLSDFDIRKINFLYHIKDDRKQTFAKRL